jgi:hypothetical protein
MDTKTAYKLAYRAIRLIEYRERRIFYFPPDEIRALMALYRAEFGYEMIERAQNTYADSVNTTQPFMTANLPGHVWTHDKVTRRYFASIIKTNIRQHYAEYRAKLPGSIKAAQRLRFKQMSQNTKG